MEKLKRFKNKQDESALRQLQGLTHHSVAVVLHFFFLRLTVLHVLFQQHAYLCIWRDTHSHTHKCCSLRDLCYNESCDGVFVKLSTLLVKLLLWTESRKSEV